MGIATSAAAAATAKLQCATQRRRVDAAAEKVPSVMSEPIISVERLTKRVQDSTGTLTIRDQTKPVLEQWTTLTAAAATTRHVEIGSFVVNVMNRHPALVARMASTLQIASGGRLLLGIGIGGAPKEHAAYGIDFPPPPERVARLEEAVAVMRALWTGGPVTRDSPFYPLHEAFAHPVPVPAPPRKSVTRSREAMI